MQGYKPANFRVHFAHNQQISTYQTTRGF